MNASDLSTGSKLLLGASAVLVIDLFLSWQKACVGLPGIGEACGSKSGWNGIGVLVGLLAIALIAWEVVVLLGKVPELPAPAALVSAALAALVAIFGLILFLSHNEARHWPAWVGLICLVVIAVGAFRRFQEGGGSDAIPRQMPASGGAAAGGSTGGSTAPGATSTPPATPAPSAPDVPGDEPAPGSGGYTGPSSS